MIEQVCIPSAICLEAFVSRGTSRAMVEGHLDSFCLDNDSAKAQTREDEDVVGLPWLDLPAIDLHRIKGGACQQPERKSALKPQNPESYKHRSKPSYNRPLQIAVRRQSLPQLRSVAGSLLVSESHGLIGTKRCKQRARDPPEAKMHLPLLHL